MKKNKSELRYDILSDEWVIFSEARRKRPNNVLKKGVCPFCDLKDQEDPKLYFLNGKINKNKEWTTVVIPNKYPILNPGDFYQKEFDNNFYKKIKTSGFHDLIITKEHDKFIPNLSIKRIKEIFSCMQKLMLDYKAHSFIKHVAIFHNRGEKAGASQPHPHYQVLAMPLIGKDFKDKLKNYKSFIKKEGQCLHCKINEIEIKNKKRIICQNKDFIAFCPFASKNLFQVIISPKRHFSNFEEITEEEKLSMSKIFKKILYKYEKGFDNLNYNFFLHTAPFDKDYPYFHWYWSFVPRQDYFAGLEIGFGMEISSMFPESQAKFLRSIK